MSKVDRPPLIGTVGFSAAFYLKRFWDATFSPYLPGYSEQELSELPVDLCLASFPDLLDFYRETAGNRDEWDCNWFTIVEPRDLTSKFIAHGILPFADYLDGAQPYAMVRNELAYKGHTIALVKDIPNELYFIAVDLLDFITLVIRGDSRLWYENAPKYHAELSKR